MKPNWHAFRRGLYMAGFLAVIAFCQPAFGQTSADGGGPADGLSAAVPPAASAATTPGVTRNLLSVLRSGGPMLIPLAACSFLLFLFAFERSISLRRGRVIPKPFVRRLLAQIEDEALEPEEALQKCRDNGSPIAEVFAAGIMKWNRPAVEVEQAIIDTGERVAQGLRRYLRLFNGISTISPLLGLLGTVLGMISAFNAIASASAMGRPELLAKGISQALLTTAAGLSVAIPAIVTYLYFAEQSRSPGRGYRSLRPTAGQFHCRRWLEGKATTETEEPRSGCLREFRQQ